MIPKRGIFGISGAGGGGNSTAELSPIPSEFVGYVSTGIRGAVEASGLLGCAGVDPRCCSCRMSSRVRMLWQAARKIRGRTRKIFAGIDKKFIVAILS